MEGRGDAPGGSEAAGGRVTGFDTGGLGAGGGGVNAGLDMAGPDWILPTERSRIFAATAFSASVMMMVFSAVAARLLAWLEVWLASWRVVEGAEEERLRPAEGDGDGSLGISRVGGSEPSLVPALEEAGAFSDPGRVF